MQFFSLLVSLFVILSSMVLPATPLVPSNEGPLLNVSIISDA